MGTEGCYLWDRCRMFAIGRYLWDRRRTLTVIVVLAAAVQLYLCVFCATHLYMEDLIYLDVLLALAGGCLLVRDYRRWHRLDQCIKAGESLTAEEEEELLGSLAAAYVAQERAKWEEELRQRVEELANLSDYVTRWSHEAKLPLAALGLMNRRNQDESLRRDMEGPLVQLESLIRSVLMGSKLRQPEHDVRYARVLLADAVREAIRNHSWYLIHEQVELRLELGEWSVYGDQRWLVYLLDQLIGNAVKYRNRERASWLHFAAHRESEEVICLTVEDNGIGIPEEELPYIFERGYVGRGQRSGGSRSTGMGLYFVQQAAELLHSSVHVRSQEGAGTTFELRFASLAGELPLS